jgi:hypothetical protein
MRHSPKRPKKWQCVESQKKFTHKRQQLNSGVNFQFFLDPKNFRSCPYDRANSGSVNYISCLADFSALVLQTVTIRRSCISFHYLCSFIVRCIRYARLFRKIERGRCGDSQLTFFIVLLVVFLIFYPLRLYRYGAYRHAI